jgi:hypothetical protein
MPAQFVYIRLATDGILSRSLLPEMLGQGLTNSLSQALLQSLHCPQIIHITAVKTIATIIHLRVRFLVPPLGISSWHL